MNQKRYKQEIIILGCGSSAGVPRADGDWGACNPKEAKNRRTRCSVLVRIIEFCNSLQASHNIFTLLIDTSPDLRMQLLNTNTPISEIDAVLYTHAHADQLHGIDDLRPFALKRKKTLPVYADEKTLKKIKHRFEYCFSTPIGGIHPPILTAYKLPVNQHSYLNEDAIKVFTLKVEHGPIMASGFRIGDFAYFPDVSHIYEKDFSALEGLELFVIDALQYKEHPSHANLDKALKWIERLSPKKAILTNLHIDMDYQTLKNNLPKHIEPAYDNMEIQLDTKLSRLI